MQSSSGGCPLSQDKIPMANTGKQDVKTDSTTCAYSAAGGEHDKKNVSLYCSSSDVKSITDLTLYEDNRVHRDC